MAAGKLGTRVLLLAQSMFVNSHMLEVLAIGEELTTRGHDVYTLICANSWPLPKNATKRLLKSPVKELEYHVDPAVISELDSVIKDDLSTRGSLDILDTAQRAHALNVKFILDNTYLMKTIKDLKFDLAVIDLFFIAPYFYLIAHVHGIPFVSTAAQVNQYVGGSPLLPSIHSNVLLNDVEQHSFSYRLLNTLYQVTVTFGFKYIDNGDYLLKEYAPNVRSWQQLIDQSMLFFVTRDYVLDHPQPYFPNVIATPPLTYTKAKPLSGEFQQLVSESTNGIIVVSFSSISHTFSQETMGKLMTAFSQLNETVVMRVVEETSARNVPQNVKVFSWLPQNDLLAHERTKLFITHGGNNGVYESLFNGVPMIGFPCFAEQPYQVRLVEARGYGLRLDTNTFTPEQLVKAVNEILTNPKYSANVKKASAILKDRPMTSRQTVAFWIEHVIKHGYQHLRSHAMDLAWYEYFMVDGIVFLLGAFIVGVALIYYSIRLVCCTLRKRIGHYMSVTKIKTN
jgi:UDP:flavonoid glycosyltransferase YjiC (YdhE family)